MAVPQDIALFDEFLNGEEYLNTQEYKELNED